MNTKKWFLGVLSICILSSCDPDSDSDKPLGAYDGGMFVTNEGDFDKGSVSYISKDGETVLKDVFGTEYPGESLGSFVQSIFFDGDRAFIIENGSNSITVVNRYTFEKIGKITTGLSVPRYGVIADGKAYVTNLSTFGSLTDDYVAVIDLQTLVVTESIVMNALADKIVAANGKLYVANSNFGSGSGITVVNASTNTITTTIPTEVGPNSMEVSNGNLYVMCGSYTDRSALLKINLSNHTVESNVTLPESMGNAQNLDIENSLVYFTVNSNVYAVPLFAEEITDSPIFESDAVYLYGFVVNNDKIYVADARDFSSNGSLWVYNLSGVLQNEFIVGLNPNGVYFN